MRSNTQARIARSEELHGRIRQQETRLRGDEESTTSGIDVLKQELTDNLAQLAMSEADLELHLLRKKLANFEAKISTAAPNSSLRPHYARIIKECEERIASVQVDQRQHR
jgi:hypothetical protein